MFQQHEGMLNPIDFIMAVTATEPELLMDNKGVNFYNVPAAFDLEASSFIVNDERMACMYIWQFGMNGYVTYGRTWNEFERFFKLLPKVFTIDANNRLIVYVHNLKYDFQWFRKRFKWDKTFFLDERQPVMARTGGIEFRDSLVLAGGVSLKTVGKNLIKYPVEKAVGDLNYDLIRTPETPLTSTELHYCENDVRVIMSYIQEKIENERGITNIPLTNTGYVRRYCRKACFPEMEEVYEFDGRLETDS